MYIISFVFSGDSERWPMPHTSPPRRLRLQVFLHRRGDLQIGRAGSLPSTGYCFGQGRTRGHCRIILRMYEGTADAGAAS